MRFSFIILICFFSALNKISEAQTHAIDSLTNLLPAVSDTQKISLLMDLATRYKNISEYDKGMDAIEKGLTIAQKLSPDVKQKMEPQISSIYALQGIIYSKQGKFIEAFTADTISLNLRTAVQDQRGISASLSNIAILFDNQGNYSKAIEYQFQALEIREKLGDQQLIAASLGNIGEVYRGQGDYVKALDYYNRSLNVAMALDKKATDNQLNKLVISNALNNIALIYSNTGDLKKSLEYDFRALAIRQEMGDKKNIAASYNNIGLLYVHLGKPDSALYYQTKSLELKKQIGDAFGISVAYVNLGDLYFYAGDLKNAKMYYEQSLPAGYKNSAFNLIKDGEAGLSEVYEKMGNGDSALVHYKKFIAARDSIYNVTNAKNSVRSEMNYKFEKEEAKKQALQDKKDAIADEQLKQQKVQLNYFIAGFVLVLLLALFILRGYRIKKKSNELLERKNTIIEEKQKEILDSIHYAKRIQDSLLPTEKYIDRKLNHLKGNREKGV